MTGQLCRCGHNKLSHEVENAPACCHDGCGCNTFRLLTPGQSPAPVVGTDYHALLRAAKDTGAPKCVGLAERIEAQLEQLRERIDHEHARAAARAEVRRLEQELAAARKQANGGRRYPPRQANQRRGDYPCPDCPEVKTTPQGLGVHRARKHGYRREDVA